MPPSGPQATEPRPKQPIDCPQLRAPARLSLQDRQLMPQRGVLDLERRLALQARDVGGNQDAINVVMNRYWGPDHRPASTTVEIVRLATDPRFILAVEAVAVLPD